MSGPTQPGPDAGREHWAGDPARVTQMRTKNPAELAGLLVELAQRIRAADVPEWPFHGRYRDPELQAQFGAVLDEVVRRKIDVDDFSAEARWTYMTCFEDNLDGRTSAERIADIDEWGWPERQAFLTQSLGRDQGPIPDLPALGRPAPTSPQDALHGPAMLEQEERYRAGDIDWGYWTSSRGYLHAQLRFGYGPTPNRILDARAHRAASHRAASHRDETGSSSTGPDSAVDRVNRALNGTTRGPRRPDQDGDAGAEERATSRWTDRARGAMNSVTPSLWRSAPDRGPRR